MPLSFLGDIEEKDGKIYLVTRREITKEQLAAKKQQMETQKTNLEASIAIVDTKLSAIK